MAATITPENFPGICDDRIWRLLNDSVKRAGADEGSVWIVDSEMKHLVISYNSGPNAEAITGFQQSLDEGIVSLVFANEQSFVETEEFRNENNGGVLDDNSVVRTYPLTL